MSEYGKIHIYCGNGKGKTTAACGLAVRCAGSGGKVLFAQFLKDGSSSEIRVLGQISGIRVLYCPEHFGFTFRMTDTDRLEATDAFNRLLGDIIDLVNKEAPDLLVLDEIFGVYQAGLIDQRELLEFLLRQRGRIEIVLTGREPQEEILGLADYITEMRCIRHPYDTENLPAREGIEY